MMIPLSQITMMNSHQTAHAEPFKQDQCLEEAHEWSLFLYYACGGIQQCDGVLFDKVCLFITAYNFVISVIFVV
jgi:hypothetical protein